MIEKKNLKLFAEQNVNWGDVKPHRFHTAGLTVSTKNHDSQNQTGGKSLSLSLSLSLLSALCSLLSALYIFQISGFVLFFCYQLFSNSTMKLQLFIPGAT